MQYRQAMLAALTTLLPLALADFVIYEGQSNDFDLISSSWTTATLAIYPYTPDCDMVMNDVPFTSYNNDINIGGYSCDGCDIATTAVVDQTITRLEFLNGEDAIGSATSDPQPTLSYATGDRICELVSAKAWVFQLRSMC